jgi:hypothetical protein
MHGHVQVNRLMSRILFGSVRRRACKPNELDEQADRYRQRGSPVRTRLGCVLRLQSPADCVLPNPEPVKRRGSTKLPWLATRASKGTEIDCEGARDGCPLVVANWEAGRVHGTHLDY